jgi:hypothetical protein
MSGTASAGTNQVGTIGSASQLVDIESEDINNADTVTTENLVVNNTATGPFGGGVVLEAGDSISVFTIDTNSNNASFVTLFNGNPKDVLGGIIAGRNTNDFLYTFDDSSTVKRNGGGSTYTQGNGGNSIDGGGDRSEITFLPPAKNVVDIQVGTTHGANSSLGASVMLKD